MATMKKLIPVLFTAALVMSCDDGDIIVTDFEFEDQQLQWCGDEETQVFYKINNEGVFEAIALSVNMPRAGESVLLDQEGELTIEIDGQNQVVYRTFSGEVGTNYFCSSIPPSAPGVAEEYTSSSGGTIIITSRLRNAEDHDGDGVPSEIEMNVEAAYTAHGYPDTDGDGIPDYLDTDDDNDNVPTSVEINAELIGAAHTAQGFPDTDGDGIPNYRDPDDDNDGVLTREEDWNESRDPTDDVNEDGLPHYLNPEISDRFPFNSFRPTTIRRSFRYTIELQDLTLVRQGGDGEQIRLGSYTLGTFDSPEETYDPADDIEGEDPDNEEDGDEDGDEDETPGDGDDGANDPGE